jgi:hypothetical protein
MGCIVEMGVPGAAPASTYTVHCGGIDAVLTLIHSTSMPVLPKIRGVPQLPLYTFTWSLSRRIASPLELAKKTGQGAPPGTVCTTVDVVAAKPQSLAMPPTTPAQGSYSAKPTKVWLGMYIEKKSTARVTTTELKMLMG